VEKGALLSFGHGLSYTEYEYGDVSLSASGIQADESFKASAKITNKGNMAGDETVQLYIRGYGNSVRRRGKELKGFKKVLLDPNETKTVEFKLGFDELKIYSSRNRYEVEEGKVKISVGSNPDLPLSAFIETQTEVKNI
jgi:beta-glucosidase